MLDLLATLIEAIGDVLISIGPINLGKEKSSEAQRESLTRPAHFPESRLSVFPVPTPSRGAGTGNLPIIPFCRHFVH